MAEQELATKQDMREIKQDIREFKEEIVRHFGVVAEGLEDKIQIVAEGHQMLADKMGRMEKKLDKKIDGVEQKVDRLGQRVDGIDQKVNRLGLDLTEHRNNTETHNIKLKKGKG